MNSPTNCCRCGSGYTAGLGVDFRFSRQTARGLIAVFAILILADPRAIAGPLGVQAEVTSDTPAYCQQLAQRVHTLAAPGPEAAEATDLADAGHRLCQEGNVIGGIRRLRRALVIELGTHQR